MSQSDAFAEDGIPLQAEYGSSFQMSQKISGTLYDHEGRKIEMPVCKDCNTSMCCIIGEKEIIEDFVLQCLMFETALKAITENASPRVVTSVMLTFITGLCVQMEDPEAAIEQCVDVLRCKHENPSLP